MFYKHAYYTNDVSGFCRSEIFKVSLEDKTAVSPALFFEKYRHKARFVNFQSMKAIDWNACFVLNKKYTIVGHMLGRSMQSSCAYAKLNKAPLFTKKEVTFFLMALLEERRAGRPNSLCDWLFSNFSHPDFQVYYLRMNDGVVRVDLNRGRRMFDIDFFVESNYDDFLAEKVVIFEQEHDVPALIAA